MKSYLYFFVCIFLLKVNSLYGADTQNENYVFFNPTPGEISIIANGAIPDDKAPTKEDFINIVDCGFNVTTIYGDLKYQFSLINDLPLKFLVPNRYFENDAYIKTYNLVGAEKKLAGWILCDEPAYSKLKEVSHNYKLLHDLDPNHLIYINLVGANIEYFTGPSKDYDDYLRLIQNTLHPSLWSYDLYPMSQPNGKLRVAYDLFYSDLESIKKISQETERPFWAFCQTMSFKNGNLIRPAATKAYLTFEAFSALAYGAQGIVYWTYALRNSNENETYYSALVDLQGKKSKAWYAAQEVNHEIKKYNDIFYQCSVQDVKHTGNNLYGSTKKLVGEFGPFSRIETGKEGVLASHIKNNGKEYIVFVNHSVEKKQKVSLITRSSASIKELTTHYGKRITSGSNKLDFVLPAGGYAIFEFKEF